MSTVRCEGAMDGMRWTKCAYVGVGIMLVTSSGCVREAAEDAALRSGDLQTPPRVSQVPAPLPNAYCEIEVEGIGVIDLETNYLPHVINCENGGGNLEALKAQAIAARSVAYYSIETSGSVCDSQQCQVYSCGSEPQAIHYQAVEETSGQYTLYNSTLTYAFYVAGDSGVSGPTCIGTPGASSTEQWVTYNEGRSGTDVEQTDLGFVHEPGDNGYGQNRGCMSQWSARCLENELGYDVYGIMRFFYGDDIIIEQAQGDCVLPVDPQDTGGSGDTGSSTGDSTGSGEGGSAGGVTGASTDDDDGDPTGAGGSTGFRPALPGGLDGGADDGADGCACRSEPQEGTAGWWAGLGLWVLFGRRRIGGHGATDRTG